MHSHRSAPKPAVAIVGGESLLGKELRELLESSGISAQVRAIASPDDLHATSVIASGPDEPAILGAFQAADVSDARAVFLAGPAESSLKALRQIRSASPAVAVIDVSGGLEDQPGARLRAPMVEPTGFEAGGEIHVIAHPAAIALALFLTRLRKAGAIRRSLAEIFEPASERGQAGLAELQKQTVGLLSFKPPPKDVFDAQAAFNMLTQYGEDAPHSLGDIELKIDRHLASLLAASAAVPMPSLKVIQAPVFHGYSISLWAEFEEKPTVEALARALTAPNIDVRTKEHEPPTNVGVAGQGGITVGAIAADRNNARACWFWIVADNLRIAAENAMEVARAFLG